MSFEEEHDLSTIEARAWKEHHTVLVFGQISRAVWWPPRPGLPGILAAADLDQAREALDTLTR